MRRAIVTVAAIAALTALAAPFTSLAGIFPPRPGVEIPQAYYDRVAQDRNAFEFQRAWIQKAERIKQNRERYISERGFYHRQLLSTVDRAQYAVTGTVQVPVFCIKFSNTGADPFPVSTLQTKLFDGPYSPQTLTQMYTEMSYGDINMTGTVYGWTTAANADTYYEGGCQGLCNSANVGELLVEALNANDAAVDFGIYDNDGPDGIPNSGDDDGFVDFAAFVHPEVGAECGNSNIWSHRWVLGGWTNPGGPWTSNDPANGGGFIRVYDYVIQPAWNCAGPPSVIDIGVFAHEFGHAFGLPDLYDTNGGSAGIGHWGLMGSGSWNSVTQPAHMCAWSKQELGWTNIVEVDGNLTPYAIGNVEFNRPIYRATLTDERWRRRGDCAIAGTTSMTCGLDATEAAARAWSTGLGYGDGWRERVSREFTYDGGTPVTLEYDYAYDSESGYDYTYGRIDVGGTVSTFATYDGNSGGMQHATVDLTPYLSGSGASSYTVSFEFEADPAWSDRDGNFDCACAPFVFDNVSLTGGGESYFTDFETREDGWCDDVTDSREYFFIENRQPVGSDVNLWGGGGLNIWHVDENLLRLGQGGNQGGASGQQPQAVKLEQADNLDQLGSNANRGDAGDPYPGSTNNTLFDGASAPDSRSNSGNLTNASVVLLTGNGDPINVSMSGNWPPPGFASMTPSDADNDQVVLAVIDGSGFACTPAVSLVDGITTTHATKVTWVGKDLIEAEFDLNGATPGSCDIVITNPGGASITVPAVFTVNDVVSSVDSPVAPRDFRLGQNYPNPFNPATVIPFDIRESVPTTLRVYNIAGQVVRTLVDETLDARSYAISWDGRNDAGQEVSSGVYFYKLEAGSFQDVRKLVLMK